LAHQARISARRVLHVAPPDQETAREFESGLQQAGWNVVECPDVYRALARIGRAGGEFAAIVVCVDWLEAAQFEFFQLAVRRDACPRLLVYAGVQARLKLEVALRLGAHDQIRLETIGEVLGDRPEMDATAAPHKAPQATVEKAPAGDEPAVAPATAVAPAAQPESEPSDSEEEAPAEAEAKAAAEPPDSGASGTVRVPWLRYSGGPQRTPPKKTPDQKGPTESARPQSPDAAPAPEAEPPLLSQEELDALLGDVESDNAKPDIGKKRPAR